MKRLLAWSVPVALVALAVSCSDDDSVPSNGVPSPEAG